MNILCYRSPYLRRILTSNKKNNDNVLAHIKLPNVLPEIFQTILEYIYGDPKTWSDDDLKSMKKILQHCLPLIRFFSLSSIEFSQKVRPYQKLLDQQLYEELLNSYLEPGSVSKYNVLRPRKIKINEIKIEDSQIIDSKIVDYNIISTVFKWVDKVVINDDNYEELYLPYKCELLLRGSRDGFTPKIFHELCNNKPNTVAFIKVNGAEEIIGGYNPIKWNAIGWGITKDSFIFSFVNKNVKDAIISNVVAVNCAINCGTGCGPYFGNDIIICSTEDQLDYYGIRCKKNFYEKKIRDTEDCFSIEDYEVFQIVKR
ncbi:hypothetical protein GLOIN_2v1868421 [Rhizophagus irregularis DAOM 181602=DAOM 197198]|nr:hypothetical protein GLOIN_2v1868421 [Rhizophagus irregularis DAOM 181602=DAOM 197198]